MNSLRLENEHVVHEMLCLRENWQMPKGPKSAGREKRRALSRLVCSMPAQVVDQMSHLQKGLGRKQQLGSLKQKPPLASL
jgi:hypothetical protein